MRYTYLGTEYIVDYEHFPAGDGSNSDAIQIKKIMTLDRKEVDLDLPAMVLWHMGAVARAEAMGRHASTVPPLLVPPKVGNSKGRA